MPFPSTLHVRLPEFQRDSLDFLREHHPDECTDEELLHLVLARGILSMMESEPGTKVSMRKSLAFPSRMNMMIDLKGKEDWADLHARDEEYDRETARMNRDLGLTEDGDAHAVPHRHVEQTLWVQMPEEMRQSFEDFLDAHPDLDENDALRLLLALALDQEEQVKQ